MIPVFIFDAISRPEHSIRDDTYGRKLKNSRFISTILHLVGISIYNRKLRGIFSDLSWFDRLTMTGGQAVKSYSHSSSLLIKPAVFADIQDEMRKKILFFFFQFMLIFHCYAKPDLSIVADDMYASRDKDGAVHLYIRKKPDIASVLLVESTDDPEKKIANHALRTLTYNPVNGDEKRILDGKFLDPSKDIYSIIDSTPEKNERFGEAFHLYLPLVLKYGFPGERMGKIYLSDGVFLNVRCFVKPYADYTGPFGDNPFRLKMTKKPIEEPPKDIYNKDAVKSFEEISEKGKGKTFYAVGNEDMLDKLRSILENEKGDHLDLVIAFDTTKSMEDNIPYIKAHLIEVLKDSVKHFKSSRFGLVLYKDYNDEYLVKSFPFETDPAILQKNINEITVKGGHDTPEAVYEALHSACSSFTWEADARLIILVGDAPPHTKPKGKITADMVFALADSLSVKINMIIYPE